MASYKSGSDPPPRTRAASREASTTSKRYGTYTPDQPKDKRSSWSLGRAYGEQAQPSPYTAPAIGDTRNAAPVYPRCEDSLSKPKSSHFGFHRTPKQPPSREASPSNEASPSKGKHTRNVLRRKPSSISQHASGSRVTLGSERSPPPAWSNGSLAQYGNIPDSMTSLIMEVGHGNDTSTSTPRMIPELERYRYAVKYRSSKEKLATEIPHKLYTHDLSAPTPLHSSQSGQSRYSGASPSTQFSEASGPASYSRNTTPTSMSSQSPGITIPNKGSSRIAHVSPTHTRPPVTRRRAETDADLEVVEPQGLPSVRESLNSSSSSSTVKDFNNEKGKEKKKKRLSPPPPSPPPRKSSQRARIAREQETASGPTVSPILGSGNDLATLQYAADAHMIGRSRTAPPMRPSREGTPDLSAHIAQLGESVAFIRSNLHTLGSSGESSSNFPTSPLSRSASSTPLNINRGARPVLYSQIPARGYSPGLASQKTRASTSKPSNLGTVPDLRPKEGTQSERCQRTPSPGAKRFALFGRRTVTEPNTPRTVLERKNPRRGPQAGTGHEGYGRHAFRGRSTSSTALNASLAVDTSRDRSTSIARPSYESHNGKATQDSFFLQRMSPVIITGGGGVPELRRTESATNLAGLPRPSLESKALFAHPLSPQTSLSKDATTRTTLWPSALPRNFVNKSQSAYPLPSVAKDIQARRPSESSEMEVKPTLAVRRSMQRLLVDQEPLTLPKPINVMSRGTSPAISSHDASMKSLPSLDEIPWENVGLRRVAKSKIMQKPCKPPRSPRKQKWNLFLRTQAGKPGLEISVPPIIAEPAPVAHYAMMLMDEQEALENAVGLEDIMREVAEAETTRVELETFEFGTYSGNLRRQGKVHQPASWKYESPPDLRADVDRTRAQLEPQETAIMRAANVTRPRLQQVGRIPQVTPARTAQMSPKSFSRPFARMSMTMDSGTPDVANKASVAVGMEGRSIAEPTLVTETGQEIGAGVGDPSSSETTEHLRQAPGSELEHEDFFRFSHRKSSVVTTSSSSYSGLLNATENITAVVPDSQDPLEEDEVWDEYDDLTQGGEGRGRISHTSSLGNPFRYENYESRAVSKDESHESEIVHCVMDKRTQVQGETPGKSTSSSEFDPQSFISGYRNSKDILSAEVEKVPRSSASTRRSSIPPASSMHRKSASLSSHSRHSSDSMILKTTAKPPQSSPLARVNLRVGSMTVSKWLTFGHVLFSPIRKIIADSNPNPNPLKMLIIDGLGNADWSFYAAETYPQVTFYNMSPIPSPSSTNVSRESAFHPATPDNHKQIQQLSLSDRFPFPGNMFNAVIIRFPRASPQTTYKNVVAEAKRVLKPGGWLECNILDLKMANMGRFTRHAVRELKVKIQGAHPAVHLQSPAEMIEWLVAKKGFSERKSCTVGIPVASAIASVSATPAPSKSNASATTAAKGKKPEEEESLADLMRDTSPSSDAGIAKSVASVGRWWYSRCYESLILPNDDPEHESIWNDQSLLNECAKWNTSFSLLVGYARKPVAGNWRTRGSSV